jgi:putative transposase
LGFGASALRNESFSFSVLTTKNNKMITKQYHTPAHLFLDNQPYFITGAIFKKRRLLADSELKQVLLTIIKRNFQKLEWQLNAYVILDNHYHLLGISNKGEDLATLIRGIHGASSRVIRQKVDCELPVWWNYWDYCPRGETDYYTKLNYLLTNPIKHGYVSDLNDYSFSSFPSKLKAIGREAMIEQFRVYADYSLVDLYDDF